MPEAVLTYGLLDKRLRALGFTARTQQGKARIYKHEQTGASVILPDAPLADEVPPHHLVVARRVLREHQLGSLDQEPTSPTPDREKSELAWQAFFLGLRLALATRGSDLSDHEITSMVGPLYAIATSDNSLHDPAAAASGTPGPAAKCVISVGNQSMKVDRDLAVLIVRGFEAATNRKDAGERTGVKGHHQESALHGAD